MSTTETRPIPNSYWVDDGRILAGEYPGAGDPAVARDRLERFVDAGVRLFIDLTEEGEHGLEPYSEVLRSVADARRVEVEHRRMPIRDVSVPTRAEEMAAILDALDQAVERGNPVYVHCWGGTGRTGTVVGCYFRRRGRNSDDALAELRRRWGTMEKAPHRAGTPETDEQVEYVRRWAEPGRPRTGLAGPPSREDRIAGCLLGGAVGDALGAPVEFLSLAHIRRQYGPGGIRDMHRAYGRVGAITDDTQMTLFTAEGLLRARRRIEEGGDEDPRPPVYRAYLRWLLTQGEEVPSHLHGERGWLLDLPNLHSRRAPGNNCLSALRSGVMGTRDRRINTGKGCGGVMRAAPAGLVGADDPFSLGCDVAAITHSHPAGFLSSGFLALLIARLLEEDPLEAAVATAAERLAREPEHEETSRAVEQAVELARSADASPETLERLGGGWVGEEALAIAVYCALAHPDDLESAVILGANHSGDTDSTAAIAGNIMGTLLGRSAIPSGWLEKLELRDAIERMAADLVVGYEATPEWRRRYPEAV